MPEMLSIPQLAKRYEQSERMVRYYVLRLITEGKLVREQDYRIENESEEFHRRYFVNPDRFRDEATKLSPSSRFAAKLQAIGTKTGSTADKVVAEEPSPAVERLYQRIASLQGEAGKWKGRHEIERESRVRAEERAHTATNNLIGATAKAHSLRRQNEELQDRLLLLESGNVQVADIVQPSGSEGGSKSDSTATNAADTGSERVTEPQHGKTR